MGRHGVSDFFGQRGVLFPSLGSSAEEVLLTAGLKAISDVHTQFTPEAVYARERMAEMGKKVVSGKKLCV